MNKTYALLIAGLFLGACAAPQPKLTQDARLELDPSKPPADLKSTKIPDAKWAAEAAKICAQPGFECIQTPVEVSLQKPDGSLFHLNSNPPEITIQDGGSIYILAGQSLNVEADIVDGKLTNMHLVDKIVHPEKTLTIKLFQADKPTKTLNMMLIVHNPFDKTIKYSAGMMVLDGPDGAIYATDSCPVMAKIMGIENWPMPIFQLVLTNFHTLDANDKMTCGY